MAIKYGLREVLHLGVSLFENALTVVVLDDNGRVRAEKSVFLDHPQWSVARQISWLMVIMLARAEDALGNYARKVTICTFGIGDDLQADVSEIFSEMSGISEERYWFLGNPVAALPIDDAERQRWWAEKSVSAVVKAAEVLARDMRESCLI